MDITVDDIIRLSTNDPWWITLPLLVARPIAIVVMLMWAVDMVRNMPSGERKQWPWRMTWPWCLTWWLVSVALTVAVNIARVLLIGHIREQTVIGQTFRYIEVAVSIHFAAWSIIAFLRWRNPKGSMPKVSSFAADAAAMIDGTASDVAEVKADVKDIQRKMRENGSGT